MSDEPLHQSINALINGTITEAEHQSLQNRLKEDASTRAIFRERMDIEAGLRTWAADGGAQKVMTKHSLNEVHLRTAWGWRMALIATAASILAIAVWWTQRPDPDQFNLVDQQSNSTPQANQSTVQPLGKWIAQADCVWQQPPSLSDELFNAGMIKLTSGAAELRFDSGTNVVLEGPCELLINTADSARLLAGTVFVNVTEVSNGFLLETPEAQIIDEGTQYAVTLDSQATEIHVFDGSVIWTPTAADVDADANFEDRIATGEARRYLRNEPGRARHIPFGQRQFVRRIEQQVRESANGELIAYDGFENLAGQIRRDRSGFGWSGGWESAGFGRGRLAEVIDAPPGVIFGNDRSGRRLMSFRGGESLRRQFEKPIELSPGETIFVSLLISRQASPVKSSGEQSSREQSSGEREDYEQSAAIQIVLEPDSESPRFTRRHSVSFGVKSDQRMFLNNSGTINETATSLVVGEPHLLVLMYHMDTNTTTANLRVYRANELVDEIQPSVWTVLGTESAGPTRFASIRLSLGTRAAAQIDELRISNSWNAAIDPTR
ncbi:MAG: FecR domain-containing protein [Pirellulaceae bacterium]|nr:FecR domain-containing protein [Pirellulaceae bacterium]